MNNTKRNNAILKVEAAATHLIAQAEVVFIGDSEWSRKTRRETLLECARSYSRAIDALGKLPA